MKKNFFKVALRNLSRQKGYSLLNLFGLAIGISCGLLLTLHIKEELSYEKNFPKHNHIYRVVTTEWSKSHPPLAAEMTSYFPEIQSTARFSDLGTQVVSAGPERKAECKGYFADSSAVEVFDFKIVQGDAVKALSEPNSFVITRSMAEKFFGKADPIGQKLVRGRDVEGWVKAVMEDLPPNTHLKFDYLCSMPTMYKNLSPGQKNSRGWMFGWTYVLFKNNDDVKKVEKKFSEFWVHYNGPNENRKEVLADAKNIRFQPLTDIHLTSNLIQEMGPNSSIIYIYIFIAVEVLILIIACVNFINLFTTQALKRVKEVAIRKVLGAKKAQVVLQFLGEALILTLLAGIVAIGIYQAALPFYNSIADKQVSSTEIFRPANLLILVSIIFFTGVLSGLFPALFISGFKPATTLKGTKLPKSPARFLRNGLITFQFVVAAFLLIATVLIYQQMNLFHNKQLGFDKDQVVVVRLYGELKQVILKEPGVITTELLSNPDIIAVGQSSNLIGDDLSVESVTPVNRERDGVDYPSVRVFRVDDNYLNVLSIPLKEGRNFSRAFNDSASFILNEKAVQTLGLKNPVGATLVNNSMGLQGTVIGVLKDFHFASLHNQVEPLVLEYRPKWTGNLLVKIKAGKAAATVSFLQQKVEKIAPGTLFSYGFLDERINGLYKKENNMSQVLKVFSILAIIISCLGLFGLSAHAAQVRTKEIGIRKVIGAGLGSIIKLLSKDFILLVLIGNVIAWPLAWYAVNKWLQEFTYKIDIRWPVFAVSALVTLAVALITIGFHCIKTARANPVKSLRTE